MDGFVVRGAEGLEAFVALLAWGYSLAGCGAKVCGPGGWGGVGWLAGVCGVLRALEELRAARAGGRRRWRWKLGKR